MSTDGLLESKITHPSDASLMFQLPCTRPVTPSHEDPANISVYIHVAVLCLCYLQPAL